MKVSDDNLSGWLAEAMKRRKMSQRQLAIRSGIDHSTVSRIIHGTRAPGYATVEKLAGALGYDLILIPRFPSRGPSR